MKLDEIASAAGLTVVGDNDMEVDAVRYAEDASEQDLAVVFTDREIKQTRAHAVLTEPRIVPADKTALYCAYGEISVSISKIAKLFSDEHETMPHYRPTLNGCFFGNDVKLGAGTQISPGTVIGDNVVIGSNTIVEPQVYIGSQTIIGNSCIIRAGAKIGAASFLHYEDHGRAKSFAGIGRTILGNGVTVGYNAVIQRGTLGDTIIDDCVLIGNLVIVAHDVWIGESSRIVCQSGIAGRAQIGSHVRIMGQSGVVDGISIGERSMIMAKSVATKNVGQGEKISGMYGRNHKEELYVHAMMRRDSLGG